MKKYLWLLLGSASLSCHHSEQSNSQQPIAPDAATRIAGVYDLTRAMSYQKVIDRPGSLTLVRVDAQRVKPIFQIIIPDSLIGRSYWQLTEVTKDSIFYRGSGYFGGIRNGQLDLSGYGDGEFYFRFSKRQ